MAYRLQLTSAARRDLASLPRNVLRRIDNRILQLGENPRPPGTEKLKGAADLFRLRVGDHRIIFQVQDSKRVVVIARVRRREQAYRGL